MLGESPPPPPRDCFGRDDLIKSVVGLAKDLSSIALVGVGGIGKTSIALTVLHHNRVKKRFGDNRRFIRCDKFAASRANLLSRLSKVIGSDIENPKDLTSFRPPLSSKDMLIVLDNAESILDPQLADGQGIYRLVEELSQFPNICLLVTSRITTIPSTCRTIDVPTLPIDAARDTFYRIYERGRRSDPVDDILKQLDFHPLSITLLATVAHQNKWDVNRLTKEWKQRHTNVLRTEHNESFGATIELSLSSPMFAGLGPNARELLEVIAFFPQGLSEDNADWLFPTIPKVATILDKFCMLCLTHRSNGFITMLVPLRDYLCPEDPLSSPLFCAARDSYFNRLSAKPDSFAPGTKETDWIVSEDVNVEHLLNFLTSIDSNSVGVWKACANFVNLLYWRKPRQTVLGQKIKRLPDNHQFKLDCLLELSSLLSSVGNFAEGKQLLGDALKFEREKGDDYRVALTLVMLSDANLWLGLFQKGIDQAREALKIFERIDDIGKQGNTLLILAHLFHSDRQLDAAEEAAFRAIQLLPTEGQELQLCRSHLVLGRIYYSKEKKEKGVQHYKTALGIASRFKWNDELIRIHLSLAKLFLVEDEVHNTYTHIQEAKSCAVVNAYSLGRTFHVRVLICRMHMFDATSEAPYLLDIYEKLGASRDTDRCRVLLRRTEGKAKSRDAPMVSYRERYRATYPLTLSSARAWQTIDHAQSWRTLLRRLATVAHICTSVQPRVQLLFPPLPPFFPLSKIFSVPPADHPSATSHFFVCVV